MIATPMTVPVKIFLPLANLSGEAPAIRIITPPQTKKIGARMKSTIVMPKETTFKKV